MKIKAVVAGIFVIVMALIYFADNMLVRDMDVNNIQLQNVSKNIFDSPDVSDGESMGEAGRDHSCNSPKTNVSTDIFIMVAVVFLIFFFLAEYL